MAGKIITLSRQYGSGGRFIAETLAKKLGIPFYDKEIISMVAAESGLALEFIEETGEYLSTQNQFGFAANTQFDYIDPGLPIADQILIMQNNIINDLADKGDCVIVGRSADYILREREGILNVFVQADQASKIERAVNFYGASPADAEKDLARHDKGRANHYRHCTGQAWGVISNYHLVVDSGKFGIEGCADLILAAYKMMA